MSSGDRGGENGAGTRFAIIVEFELREGALADFLKLVRENASTSVRDEPGCFRFDVLTSADPGAGPDRVFLYEIYADRAAFAEHVKAPHFALFDEASRPLVSRKTVQEFEVLENWKL